MLHAGELKEKIQLVRSTKIPNESGGATFSDIVYLNTFAKIKEISSNPELIGQGEIVQNSILATIRYRTDVEIINGDKMIWREFSFTLNNFKVDPWRTQIEMSLSFESGTANRSKKEIVIPETFDATFDSTFQ